MCIVKEYILIVGSLENHLFLIIIQVFKPQLFALVLLDFRLH